MMQNKHSLSWVNPGTIRKTFSGALRRLPALSTHLEANASDVNDHRYNLFFAKNGEIELPPCKDCLCKVVTG